MQLVREAGKFRDMFGAFRSIVLNLGASFNQIHVIFDWYYKGLAMVKRKKKKKCCQKTVVMNSYICVEYV